MCPELAKKLPCQNHSQNSTFCSVRGAHTCYISEQPLYFHLMTLRRVIKAQDGVPISQSGSPTTKRPLLAKKAPSPNHPKNSMFRSIRVSDSCHIGVQPLYFHSMTLSKVTRAQEWVPTSRSGSPTTNMASTCKTKRLAKIISKTARSALLGDHIAVKLATNNSIFIK